MTDVHCPRFVSFFYSLHKTSNIGSHGSSLTMTDKMYENNHKEDNPEFFIPALLYPIYQEKLIFFISNTLISQSIEE